MDFTTMRKRSFVIGMILSFLGLTSCSEYPPSVSLSHAIGTIQADMTKAKTVPIANFLSWEGDQKMRFAYEVQQAQCNQHTSDPLLPVVVGNVILNLSGSFTKSGNFSVSGAAAGPAISAGGSASKTISQGVQVPVAFAPLSSLPYVAEEVATDRAGALLGQAGTLRDTVGQQSVAEQKAFSSYVADLLSDYTPYSCAEATAMMTGSKSVVQTQSTPAPMMGLEYKKK